MKLARKLSTEIDSIASSTIKCFKEIPKVPSLPFFGTLPFYKFGILSRLHYDKTLIKFRHRYGPIVAEYRGIKRGTVIHIFKPEDVQTVFQADGKYPLVEPLQDTALLYRVSHDLSPGLGNLNGDDWYRLRSAVQQAMMRPQAVTQYFDQVDSVAQDLVESIGSNDQIVFNADQITSLIQRWTLETAGLLTFKKRLGCLERNPNASTRIWTDEMIKANKLLFILSGELKFSLPIYYYIPTPKFKKLTKVEDFWVNESKKLWIEAVEKHNKKEETDTRKSFIDYILSKVDNINFTIKDAQIIAFSLFGDGLNTTSPTLIYNLYTLATNPEIQVKLRSEITNTCGSDVNIRIENQKIGQLAYLNACIKETFRLFPIGPDISRITQNDMALSGYHIPAGTKIDINMGYALRSTEYFSDPLKFKPERWLRSTAKVGNIHPFLLLPFGHGTRMCAGRRFADQDLRLALVRLLQRYSIEYLTSTDEEKKMLKPIYHSLYLPYNLGSFKFTKM